MKTKLALAFGTIYLGYLSVVLPWYLASATLGAAFYTMYRLVLELND